ncbi:MAG: LPP20 family lipoprotein [Bacteroidetes bacterium]|nr:LPP20 family lipoprotein [Bacteroidota bacterium]
MKKLILLLLLVAAESFSQVPKWVTAGKDIHYPTEFYWVGIGSAAGTDANALEQARQVARREVAAQLKVAVSADFSVVQKASRIGDSELVTSNLESRTESVVESMPLTGLEIAEIYVAKNDNTTYALAVLEKESFLNTLKVELDGIVNDAKTKLQSSDELSKSGEIGMAVNKYLDELTFIEPLFPKVVFYNALSQTHYEVPQEIMPESIDLSLKNLLEKIFLKKISGDNQTQDLGKLFNEPFVVQAFMRDGGDEKALKGLPVSFKVGGKLIDKVFTGDKGFASYKFLSEAEGLREGSKGTVVACVDLAKVGSELRKALNQNTSVSFSYSVVMPELRCYLELTGVGSSSAQKSLRNKLADILQKNGAILQSGAPFTIKVDLSSTDGGSMQGMGGTMVVQDVAMLVQLVDSKSQGVVGSLTANAKGLGKTKAEAVDKAVVSLKLPQSQLAEMLGKAKNSPK